MPPTPAPRRRFAWSTSRCKTHRADWRAFWLYCVQIGAPGGGQEIIIETGSSVTDDMYSEEFGSIIGDTMAYTLVLRHKDCDPQGYAKCTMPPPSPCSIRYFYWFM